MTRTERSLKSSARDAMDSAISESSRLRACSCSEGWAWTSERGCSLVCVCKKKWVREREKKQRNGRTDGSLDVVIDSGHSIGGSERNSAGGEEKILIFGRMTLEFCVRVTETIDGETKAGREGEMRG